MAAMFQRFKNSIDSRIAEEQARQKSAVSTVPRTASTARRSASRTESPRPRRSRDVDGASPRGPDPSEFEAAFVIEDESEEVSRAGTPAPADEKGTSMAEDNAVPTGSGPGAGNEVVPEKAGETAQRASMELPMDVRTKLRRLEKFEAKYQELLRSYRIAHGRVASIEPFEKALKENTPLTSISDPDSLVEYLNQLNLKGDLVMEELKRVTADRDEYKKKFEAAEKQASTIREELISLQSPTAVSASSAGLIEKADTISIDTPSASVKSPVASVLGMFSPKQKPVSPIDNKDVSEEFFSYDNEIPRLQSEVKEKTAEVENLKSEVSTLQRDLSVSQETSAGLVENLEKVTRELNESKEVLTLDQTRKEKLNEQIEEIRTLKINLQTTESKIVTLEADLAMQRKDADEKAMAFEGDLASQRANAAKELKLQTETRQEVEKLTATLQAQIKALEQSKASDLKRIQDLLDEVELLKKQADGAANDGVEESHAEKNVLSPETPTTTSGAAKKKNKKKKKASAVSSTTAKELALTTESTDNAVDAVPGIVLAEDSQAAISELKREIADRDAQIEKLMSKRKTEAELREELENMQDNFLAVGQEHVEAKERIKELQADKVALQEKITRLEQETMAHKSQSTASEKVEAELNAVMGEYENLKLKSATLQTDLGAAQQLAASRYRDLTDLRAVLEKAQPELKSLRTENANMKAIKDELATRTSDLRRLESREKDLKADLASFKKQAADRENEIRTFNEKVTQETNGRLRAEDQNRVAQRDLRKSEAEKIQLSAAGEKAALELAKVQDEAGKLRTRVHDLEDQVSKLTTESKGLREEVELRGSQYNNAQGLLGSMRGQTAEMAMQLKEAKEQADSLEEELGDVQRLLSERTREGETMRRLLADVDDRADGKVREMRERMEAAIEERDRAEDEASTNARRRAREVDELKNRIRDFEKDLKHATDERDELQRSEKDWKRRRDELEGVSEKASQEVNEIRTAMGELRNALDGSEKQVRDGEKQRSDLRRILDEANQRYEKLQKEFKALQAKQSRLNDTASRSSTDSGRGGSSINGAAAGRMDYVYLKTILLQFLEQKDKNRQADLVRTVLGQLLHFDKKDQEKWIATILAK